MTRKQLINEFVSRFENSGSASIEEFIYDCIHEEFDPDSEEMVLAYSIGIDRLIQMCKEEQLIRTASFRRIKPGHYTFEKGMNSGEIVKYPHSWWVWYVDENGDYATTNTKTLREGKFELASVTE